jgi:hypothetical protein
MMSIARRFLTDSAKLPALHNEKVGRSLACMEAGEIGVRRGRSSAG